MSTSRSWALIDESTEVSERDHAYLDALMNEWSAIQTDIEDESFRRQADCEDGDDPADHFETDEEYREWQMEDRARKEQRQVRLDIIEELLTRKGARVMRPYEHWNEDERYMEWQETRYDYAY